MINEAIRFATAVHANQTRKGTEIPYILHCLEAGTIAASMSTEDGQVNEDVVAGAILHDTIEDAGVSYGALKLIFNDNIADLVQSQSEDKTKGWMERKKHTIHLLKMNESRNVEVATLSDKLSNMRSIYRDYKNDGEKLWSKFNAGKKSQHWYYNAIAEALSQVIETDEYKEYRELIRKTFES